MDPVEKIDPDLQLLIAAHAEGTLEPSPRNPNFLTHVYVEVDNGDFGGVQAAGHALYEADDDTAIVVLPIDQIMTLAERADVTGIYAPPGGHVSAGDFEYTDEQKLVHLDKIRGGLTLPGEEVFVGVVDSGVNILHDAFRTPPPARKTRIHSLWIQDDAYRDDPADKIWKKVGVFYTEAQINHLLTEYDKPPAANAPRTTALKKLAAALVKLDMVKGADAAAKAAEGERIAKKLLDIGEASTQSWHGTSVASIAAGTPWRVFPNSTTIKTTRGGIASTAKLVVVAVEQDLLSAVLFCFAQAGNTPCVVNMSMSTEEMPHNGRALFDEKTAKVMKNKARALVAAAGNTGRVHGHARVKSSEPDLGLDVQNGVVELRAFVSSDKPVTIEVSPPGGAFAGDGAKPDGYEISIKKYKSRPGDPDTHYKIKIDGSKREKSGGTVQNGVWTFRFTGTSDRIDIWRPTQNPWPRFVPRGAQRAKEDNEVGYPARVQPLEAVWHRPADWIQHTVGGGACGAETITVAAFEPSGSKVRVMFPSSRGPVPDKGRAAKDQKPDLAAPNWELYAARLDMTDRGDVSNSTGFGGTSAAAPMVTGTVALMFEYNPALTGAQVREILRDKRTPLSTDTLADLTKKSIDPVEMFGAGILDIKLAVDEAIAKIPP
ncbi:MAG: S8 family serine peptidase [Hyphomonadaceae bacterium]